MSHDENYDTLELTAEQIGRLWGFYRNEEGTWTVARVVYNEDADDRCDFGDVVEVYKTERDAKKVCQVHNGIMVPLDRE